jgi:hypothetical protein
MTNEDIIRMAREAGFQRTKMHNALEQFAYIVAAAEREECAKVCDSYDVADDVCSSDTAEGIAIAIRARKLNE